MKEFIKYFLRVWLPFRFPMYLTIGLIFILVKYVDVKVLFNLDVIYVTNLDLFCLIPPICLIMYSKMLEYIGVGRESED